MRKFLLKCLTIKYVNIVEIYTGVSPIELGTPLCANLDQDTVKRILKH